MQLVLVEVPALNFKYSLGKFDYFFIILIKYGENKYIENEYGEVKLFYTATYKFAWQTHQKLFIRNIHSLLYS